MTGETIDHIGAFSGWTYGTISDPCADLVVSVSPSHGLQVYCEIKSEDMGGREGDSGGPVFLWDGYDGATLIGTFSAGFSQKADYTYNGQNRASYGATTYYDIFEWTWDAGSAAWLENDQYIGTITALTYSDVPWWTISAATGDSAPDSCNYDWVAIQIRANNRGTTAMSNVEFFRGPRVGSGPAC